MMKIRAAGQHPCIEKIHFFDPDDLVAGMEAGQTAAELQQLLGEKNMQLAINPGTRINPGRNGFRQYQRPQPDEHGGTT